MPPTKITRKRKEKLSYNGNTPTDSALEMAAQNIRKSMSSFTAVGHLIHVNLKDHLLQHSHEVGMEILKKCPRAIAVVNKVNTIENTYRNFDIEVVAKRPECEMTNEELMVVEVKENKCTFQLDFSKVYWNSRLSTEHERIIKKLNNFVDIVFDLFAGVGPFSVPAAKAKCMTYANDLNPESVKWLTHNMKKNKVLPHMYEITNLDAKDYILNHLKPKLLQEYKKFEDENLATKPKIHILMNLPAIAPTFLPHFIGLFKDPDGEETQVNSRKLLDVFRQQSLEHVIYCYCFLKGAYDDPKQIVREMIEENFGREMTDDQLIEIFKVRNVAPYKDMYRVEILLDESILFDIKPLAGIMKKPVKQLVTNGTPAKRVSIKETNNKRTHDDSSRVTIDEEDENNANKKSKLSSSFCTIS